MEDWKATIHNSRYTLYPICDESTDNIVGILNAKEYFRLEDKSRDNVMQAAVKSAYFVPEGVKADVLFRNMKRSHNTLAVVLDEYGGVVGIITLNDLVEKLVGDLGDEDIPKNASFLIETIDAKTWKIYGNAPLGEVSKALGVELSCQGYDTFNGLIFSVLGTIPQDGSAVDVEIQGLVIKVTEIRDHQVETAFVCLESPVICDPTKTTAEKVNTGDTTY